MKGLVMASSEQIKKICELSSERLERDTLRQLMEMSLEDLSLVFANVVAEQLLLADKMRPLANKFDELEVMYEYLKKVYQEKYDTDIDDIEISFIPEEDEDGTLSNE